MDIRHKNKRGAALLIALGFLAILMILIIAFAAQSRTERLSGRAFLTSARTRHLLQASLTMAMEEIDNTAGSAYPGFFALGSQGNSNQRMADSIDFTDEEDYFQFENPLIGGGYDAALDAATWETVSVGGTNPVGRIGYIIVNSSGLLDANAVGGIEGDDTASNRDDFITRGAGTHPREIQLSSDTQLVPELNSSGTAFDHPGSDYPASITDDALEAGLALVRNRNRAWRRFESLRDLLLLNVDAIEPNVFTSPIESFSTFSYRPENDGRTFMGTNLVTLAAEDIRKALGNIAAIPDAEYVMNQLGDYLDEDTIPNVFGKPGTYTDESVEPVPMLNELALKCVFSFFPEVEYQPDGTFEVVSVVISNTYSLDLEVWYPFTGYRNTDTFTASIATAPSVAGSAQIPAVLFGEIDEWTDDHTLPAEATTPATNSTPYDYTAFEATFGHDVLSASEMVDLFASIGSDISFPLIQVTDSQGNKVDAVYNLELPLEDAVGNGLLDVIENLSTNLFKTGAVASNVFEVSMACVDPRLNWQGDSAAFWKEDFVAEIIEGEPASAGSMGAINEDLISAVATPDDTSTPKIFVRNEDRIDTPWEFTYLLYDPSKPWRTMQMLEEFDGDEDTRSIMDGFSPYPRGAKPREGLVNPNSPHTNVLASVFLNQPLDEFNVPAENRLGTAAATDAAALFMGYIGTNGWPQNATDCGTGFDLDRLGEIIGSTDPWQLEGFFRNSYELFNPRDTLYTILLAAQAGTDADGDGAIGDGEVRGTQKAVAYVWRDPQTGKATVVFWGLSDTLRSRAVGGQSWSDILQAFNPDA